MSQLDRLGEMIINEVRDSTIDHWEMIFSGKIKNEGERLLYQTLKDKFDEEQFELTIDILTQVVDTTIHNFLI